MLKAFANKTTEYFPSIGLFLLGLLILIIRNPDAFLGPILYREDGAWLGLAFSKGWLYTFFYARDDYFVLGNLILLWIAETGSKVFCGNSLLCLPQSIGFVSVAFYSCIATLAFLVTRHFVSFVVRLLLFVVLIFLPMGDSSNEVLGRLSNVGYIFVLLSVLLVSYRERVKSTSCIRVLDLALIISAATNPVVILLIYLYLSWRLYRLRGAEWKKNRFLLIGVSLVAMLIAYKMIFMAHSEVRGILHPENLIEVGIARSILYPLLFPYYPDLSNFSTLVLFVLWLLFVILAVSNSDQRTRMFLGYNLVALWIFLGLTIGMRQSLTQQMGGYRHTFPDRYFMGINALVLVVTLVGASSLLKDSKFVVKTGATLLLTMIVIQYVTLVPWIFETENTRMPLMTGLSFFDQLCESGKALTNAKSEEGEFVIVPINFKRRSIPIPRQMLLAATEKLDCNALKPLNITDSNWDHGVARYNSGFVLASSVSPHLLRVGKSIRFVNREVRPIHHVEVAGMYMNVFLDGVPLNGKQVGYPNKIEVIE
jgi:hypothetical protein